MEAAPAQQEPEAVVAVPSKKPKAMSSEEIFRAAAKRDVLLRRLPPTELKYVKSAAKQTKIAKGSVIFEEGAMAENFYIVEKGRFAASRAVTAAGKQRLLREYEPGDTFGSHELLFQLPRSHKLVARESGSVWVLSKRVFDAKLRIAPPVKPAVLDFLKTVPLFSDLSTEYLTALGRAAIDINLDAGKPICVEGEAASEVYAIKSGELVTSKAGTDVGFTMEAPSCFGESALLCSCASDGDDVRRRQATVRAIHPGAVVVAFDVSAIETLVGFCLQERSVRAFNRKLLASIKIDEVSILDVLMKHGEQEGSRLLDWLADAMFDEHFEEGEVVAAEGAEDGSLYVIKAGEAAVSTKEAGEVATLSAGGFFGELSLLPKKHKRSATIVAKSRLRVASLPAAVVKANSELEQWRNALGNSGVVTPPKGAKGAKGAAPRTRRRSVAETMAEAQIALARAAEEAKNVVEKAVLQRSAQSSERKRAGGGSAKVDLNMPARTASNSNSSTPAQSNGSSPMATRPTKAVASGRAARGTLSAEELAQKPVGDAIEILAREAAAEEAGGSFKGAAGSTGGAKAPRQRRSSITLIADSLTAAGTTFSSKLSRASAGRTPPKPAISV